jgi:hypothetical protein
MPWDAKALSPASQELIQKLRGRHNFVEIRDGSTVLALFVSLRRLTPPDPEAVARWSRDTDILAQEIAKRWPAGVSAVDAVREQRREL